MEKLNPERAHLFDGPSLDQLVRTMDGMFDFSQVAFLGLEDMGWFLQL